MKIIRLTQLLAVLALAACDTGIEPIDQRIRTLDAWNGDWAAYAEGLRVYKTGEHYLTCVRFDNALARIESEKNCLRSLPDSLDVVVLRNPMSDFDREDVPELQKRYTKVLATADCSDPATALQRLDETLSQVASAGMDGLVLRFSGSVTAAAAALEPQIVQRLATLNDKMLAFEGNAGFVTAANRGMFDLYLLDLTAAGDVYTVGSQVDYWTGYYGIEAGRILPVVALTGTLADEQGTAQSAPDKIFETIDGRSLAGLALDGVSVDYYSLTGNYPRLRGVIDLLNPAHQ